MVPPCHRQTDEQTDGRTDGRTTYNSSTALALRASSGKNGKTVSMKIRNVQTVKQSVKTEDSHEHALFQPV